MDVVPEEDLSLLQRMWPSCKFIVRREAARLLLQDPDHRLRAIQLEALLNLSLNREVTSLELQAELCHADCAKYFRITPDHACEWSVQVVKLMVDVLAQDASRSPPPQAPKFPYLLSGGLDSERDQQILIGVVNTWSGYEENDEDYLAVVIAWVLITKKDSKGQLPTYSLHLTDVGGFLRSLTVSDTRLAHIFPRAGGGVFVSKRQKQTAKARPRLSEYLMQPRYRPFFRIKDSCVRKSEKVVSLVIERLLHSEDVPAGTASQARWCKDVLNTPEKDQAASPAAALLPDFLDGMDAPIPGTCKFRDDKAVSCSHRTGDGTVIRHAGDDSSNTASGLAPYLDPVIDQPMHAWHHRTTSLFSMSTVGSAPIYPPVTPHLAPVSRFSSSFPDLHIPGSLELTPSNCFPGTPSDFGAAADIACTNLMAAFRPETPFYRPGVEYVAQVPDSIAKCWAASLDELMIKAGDASGALGDAGSGLAPQPSLGEACSDDGSVSLGNCMIPEDSDGCESGDDADHRLGLLGQGIGLPAASSASSGDQLLKHLFTDSHSLLPEQVHVPSFAPSTPSFFVSPSQPRKLGCSTDSDVDTHYSTRSSSSDDVSESFTSPDGNFAAGGKVAVTQSTKPDVTNQISQAAPDAEADATVNIIAAAPGSSLSNWAAVAAKRKDGDNKGSKEVVFSPPPTAESKVAAAAAAAQVMLPPGAAKNLAKLCPRLRDEVLRVVRICPAMKLEDFDEGVVSQLMSKKSEDDAAAAIKSISQHDLNNIQHMAAFINFVVKNYAGSAGNAAAARGSIGGLVSRSSSVPVSSRTILQKLPLKVYKHLEEVVSACNYLEWKHFDAGVVKVLSQLAKMADEDVCEELDILLQTDLSNVEYMPAYLNKRFNNRLWSRRKVSS